MIVRPWARSAVLASAAILLATSPSLAKAPNLTGLFPAGAARGRTVTVTASGTFDHWPVQGWASGKGVAIVAAKEKGKLSVIVDADAEPGLRWVRLFDEEGATSLRPFVVGTLPEVLEAEPNDDPRSPQRIETTAVTINGRLAKTGDVDGFAVTLHRGQTLVADLEANRHLGSPMDAVLQVVSGAGFVLAQNDDNDGRDPRIVFEAPAEGSYVVRAFAFPIKPDSSIRFAGGDAYIYRLTLTTAGFLDFPFPLAVARDGPGTIQSIGSNIPETARSLKLPAPGDLSQTAQLSHPLLAGTAEVRRAAVVAVEAEPNDPGHPQAIPAQAVVSGRIDPPGDRDAFRFVLKKGEKRGFRVESRGFGLPLDAVLRLTDATGKTLAGSDDHGEDRDPTLSFTAPADGEYRVNVRDLHGRGGPRFAYLLGLSAPEPDFGLVLAADRFDLLPGKTADLKVSVERKVGYAGQIEVAATDLPPGVSAEPVISRPGDASAGAVTLKLNGDGCAHPGPFRVVGKATGEAPRRHAARAAIAGFEAKTDRPWLTIGRISDVSR
jgi:hypothetical protein